MSDFLSGISSINSATPIQSVGAVSQPLTEEIKLHEVLAEWTIGYIRETRLRHADELNYGTTTIVIPN